MIITILIFLVILSLLVFVHELGHFLVAKRSGMKVEEFGFGFPPRIFGFQKQDGKWKMVWGAKSQASPETIYSINWIPLGGFVKILGEDNAEAQNPQSFVNKPFLPRFLTLIAGVLMNALTAWLIFSIGFMVGLPTAVGDVKDLPNSGKFTKESILILEVAPGSPAEQFGIKPNDTITSVDGQKFVTIQDLQSYLKSKAGEKMQFNLDRSGEPVNVEVVSINQEGKPAVGIGLAEYGTLKFAPLQAIWQGLSTTLNQIKAIAVGLVGIFTSTDGLKSVGGPVKIAQLTGQVAELGLLPLLQFTAFLSLNLAILNILPIPALDGGRLLFLIIEKLRGKPNNQNLEQYVNAIGFMVLLLLMLVISVRDVSQLESVKNLFN